MYYDIRLEQHAAVPLAVVRRRASQKDLPKVVPEACGIVWNVVRAQKIQGAGRLIAVYLDCVINLEVGVELAAPFAGRVAGVDRREPPGTPGDDEVVGSATPAGPVATTTHYGPYNQLHAAHQAIRQWCATSGYTLAGPNWEIYVHWLDEWNADPTKIRTDVFYLLTADT